MSAAPTMCENPCETCAKEGLPLLLTRYALMPSEVGAPKLSGDLNDAGLAKISLGQGAHYGLRLLRSGYVYVYDEKRKHFDEYFVTADGFFSKMPPRTWALKQQRQPATEFQCARNGAAPMAGVITIRNPKHATKVWIGFSEAEWTKAIFDQHEDAEFRGQHMRCVTLTGGKVAHQAGTAPLESLQSQVPEFKLGQAGAAKAFATFSPHAYNGRQHAAESLLHAVQKARPQGGAAIVALHDPVGLAQEIAGLMELRKNAFVNHERVTKPRFAASTIVSLEQSIKAHAKLDELAAAEEQAAQMAVNGGLANLLPSYQTLVAKAAHVTPAHLQKVASDKWHGYTHDRTGKPRFDAKASEDWLKRYNAEFQRFDVDHIAPLAKAHVAWMTHHWMVGHMSCNFDSNDRDSGVAYTATVVDLMRGVTDKQPSYELYLKWLGSGEFTEQNLVMRALGFNQTDLIDKLKQADASPVDFRAFPTDAVVGAVGAFIEKMPPSAQALLTALFAGLSGPALKYWDDFHLGKVSGKAAAAMAAVSGKQFVRVPVVGNRGQFIQAYVQQLFMLDPELRTTPNRLQSAIAKQVRLLEIEGVKMADSRKLGWYVLLDKEVVAGATSKNTSGQALADELAKAIQRPQDIKKLDVSRSMSAAGKMAGAAKILSGGVMLLNFSKLLDDVDSGMSHEMDESRTKLMMGKFAMGAFVSEMTGDLLEKLGEQRLKNMMGRIGANVPRALQWFGRFLGFGVGVLLGLWDISKGVDEYKKGDYGLAVAYTSSGTAGILVTATLFAVGMGWIAVGPLGWAILAIGFVVWLGTTLFVETNKDNKVQEWLSRCCFGVAPEKYPDTLTHVQQYRLATGH